MASGKILWLCDRHRHENDKITVFNEEGDDYVLSEPYQKDNIALENINTPQTSAKNQGETFVGKVKSKIIYTHSFKIPLTH